MSIKTLTIRLEDDLHKAIKIKAINEGKTIQKYLEALIKADLEKDQQE